MRLSGKGASSAQIALAGVLALWLLCPVGAAGAAAADERIETLLNTASALLDRGELERATVLAREAVAEAEAPGGSAQALGAALQTLASAHTQQNRYVEATASLSRALETLEPIGPTLELADVQEELAKIHRLQADYATSLHWLRQAQQTLGHFDDPARLMDLYSHFGTVYDFLGQLDLTLEWHKKSLALARTLEDTRGIATGLYALGQVHLTLGEYAPALEHFREALALDEQTGVVRNIAYSHMKVGYTLFQLERLVEARQHLEQARASFEQMRTPRDLRWALVDLAKLDVAQGRLGPARQQLELVLTQALEAPWPSLVNMTRMALADVAQAEGRFEEAAEHLQRALTDALAQQSMARALRVYDRQAEVLELAERPAEALAALRARMQLQARLFDERRTSVIAALQGEAEFERQAAALRLAEQERALAELALERESHRRVEALVTLTAVFMFAFALYGRFSMRREHRRLSEQVADKTSALREQNKELERAYAAVDRASLTDPLTGVHNRRFLERHLPVDVARSRQLHEAALAAEESPSNADLVFFLIDMDHFKAINDRSGHGAGDRVLVEVARRLGEQCHEGDFVVRWGGEEFLLVSRFVDRAVAAAVAERVRQSIASKPFELAPGVAVSCTCSIGFSVLPLGAQQPRAGDWRAAVGLADQALYAVKRGERDGWVGFVATSGAVPDGAVADWLPQALRQGTVELVASAGVFREQEDELARTESARAS